jgi:hypothetical protein
MATSPSGGFSQRYFRSVRWSIEIEYTASPLEGQEQLLYFVEIDEYISFFFYFVKLGSQNF